MQWLIYLQMSHFCNYWKQQKNGVIQKIPRQRVDNQLSDCKLQNIERNPKSLNLQQIHSYSKDVNVLY